MANKSGKKTAHELLEDEDFKSLASQKDSISWVLTLLELLLYFGFIGLIAWNRDLLATKISGPITLGIPVAVGTIVLSWVLTGIYVYWANTKYDHLVNNVKKKLGD